MNAQTDTRIDTLAETLVIHAIMTIINISTEEDNVKLDSELVEVKATFLEKETVLSFFEQMLSISFSVFSFVLFFRVKRTDNGF